MTTYAMPMDVSCVIICVFGVFPLWCHKSSLIMLLVQSIVVCSDRRVWTIVVYSGRRVWTCSLWFQNMYICQGCLVVIRMPRNHLWNNHSSTLITLESTMLLIHVIRIKISAANRVRFNQSSLITCTLNVWRQYSSLIPAAGWSVISHGTKDQGFAAACRIMYGQPLKQCDQYS